MDISSRGRLVAKLEQELIEKQAGKMLSSKDLQKLLRESNTHQLSQIYSLLSKVNQ